MRTLYFRDPDREIKSVSRIVPAQGSRLFRGRPDVVFTPKRLYAIGEPAGSRWPEGLPPVKVTEIFRADSGDGAPALLGSIVGEEIRDALMVSPAEWIMVRVENRSTFDCTTHVAIIGESDMVRNTPRMNPPPPFEEYILGLTPYTEEPASDVRRIRVPAGVSVHGQLEFSFSCTPRKITMRSDADTQLEITHISVCNIASLMGEPVPVGMFKDGLALRTTKAESASKMSVCIRNRGTQAHYVEIDVDVEPTPNTERSASRQ